MIFVLNENGVRLFQRCLSPLPSAIGSRIAGKSDGDDDVFAARDGDGVDGLAVDDGALLAAAVDHLGGVGGGAGAVPRGYYIFLHIEV